MANFLGTCRSCEFTIFATEEDLTEVEGFGGVKEGRAARIPERGVFARCILGHRIFPLKRVKGTYSEKHQCDSRCLNARGSKCVCSCGGANHGRGHAVTVVAASSLPQWDDDGMIHIGQVDKTIKGGVFVRSKKDVKGKSILYTFLAASAPAELKWFCPIADDPEWKPGLNSILIRAKVERHDDHPQFGKSTIITDVERVDDGPISA